MPISLAIISAFKLLDSKLGSKLLYSFSKNTWSVELIANSFGVKRLSFINFSLINLLFVSRLFILVFNKSSS